MTANLFPSPPWPALPVQGEAGHYPIHRIFCVGKNYAAHAAEMGGEVNREQPIFFTKSTTPAKLVMSASIPYFLNNWAYAGFFLSPSSRVSR